MLWWGILVGEDNNVIFDGGDDDDDDDDDDHNDDHNDHKPTSTYLRFLPSCSVGKNRPNPSPNASQRFPPPFTAVHSCAC